MPQSAPTLFLIAFLIAAIIKLQVSKPIEGQELIVKSFFSMLGMAVAIVMVDAHILNSLLRMLVPLTALLINWNELRKWEQAQIRQRQTSCGA